MSWTDWLLIGAIGAGLYAFGLIGYRIFLAWKKLHFEVLRTERLIAELEATPLEVPVFSRPTSGDEFQQLLVNRELEKRRRRRAAEQRKHRLIERISSIEVDKR